MPDISESVAMLEKHLSHPYISLFSITFSKRLCVTTTLTFFMLVGGTGGRGGIEIASGSAP